MVGDETDAALGRFLSEDPIGFEAGDANLTRYVGNDPVGKVDPSGLEEPGRRAGQTVGARNTLLSDRCYAKPDWNGCDKDYTKGRLYKIGSRIYWHEFRNRFFKPKYVGKSVLLGTKKKFGMVELSTRLGGGH
ncbi:MAG TPA: hypothetical protein ENJ50_07350, partial [Planctomycetaceae bacterium]|nr:hypothetical protein [Planctomycetaceae bacterium]